ncbi:phosphodiesterase [Serratia sp. DD3]|uniref:phosphodiesterase n=1 Tax=Serratia sp. DD3 TaxID=1410619 RepID=UPI0003C4EB7B|nr:phosphodiesterase [Serratia sp. DD3]KEY60342.1 3',5'-cyclic adenosine monophosphate phosphodiesterase CpdA [Serratia sp. DD3]
MTQPFMIAHLSDLHIKAGGRLSYKKVDTLGALYAAISKLNRLIPKPDIVVISGDLVDFGRDDEYHTLRQALSTLRIPFYVVPGNHDDRQALRRAFSDAQYLQPQTEFIQWVIDDYPVRLIGLDSTLPGKSSGLLCPQRLLWLEQQLALCPDQPTLVILHHPPFVSGISHMDKQRLENPQDLASIIRRHPQVERVLCGHLHRTIETRFAGTLACSAPGLSHQVALDLRTESPAHFVLEPAGFLLHCWSEEQGMISHHCLVDDYDGPYPFYDAAGLID